MSTHPSLEWLMQQMPDDGCLLLFHVRESTARGIANKLGLSCCAAERHNRGWQRPRGFYRDFIITRRAT